MVDMLSRVSDRVRGMLGPGGPEIADAWDAFPEPGYRTSLGYSWDAGGTRLHVLGQNPSQATRERPDHTVTVCARRAWRAGHGSMAMWNLFTAVATNPSDLWLTKPRPDLDDMSLAMLLEAVGAGAGRGMGNGAVVLVAAGGSAEPRHHARAAMVTGALRAAGARLECLGTTEGGHPRHPSRASYAIVSRTWEGPWPVPPVPRRPRGAA